LFEEKNILQLFPELLLSVIVLKLGNSALQCG